MALNRYKNKPGTLVCWWCGGALEKGRGKDGGHIYREVKVGENTVKVHKTCEAVARKAQRPGRMGEHME